MHVAHSVPHTVVRMSDCWYCVFISLFSSSLACWFIFSPICPLHKQWWEFERCIFIKITKKIMYTCFRPCKTPHLLLEFLALINRVTFLTSPRLITSFYHLQMVAANEKRQQQQRIQSEKQTCTMLNTKARAIRVSVSSLLQFACLKRHTKG